MTDLFQLLSFFPLSLIFHVILKEQGCVSSQTRSEGTVTKPGIQNIFSFTGTKKVYQNLSVFEVFSFFSPALRSSQRSLNHSTMRPRCSRERLRSTMTPTETCCSARWTTSRWVRSSDPAVTVPEHLSHVDGAAAKEVAYNPTADLL